MQIRKIVRWYNPKNIKRIEFKIHLLNLKTFKSLTQEEREKAIEFVDTCMTDLSDLRKYLVETLKP